MANYFSPGIYVEEVPGGARSIGPVGTSTAGFVGVATNAEAPLNEAVAVNNWTQFVTRFVERGNMQSTPLIQAVYGFFNNGGSRCWIVNIGSDGTLRGTAGNRAGLDVLEPVDEISIVAAPGYHDVTAHEALLTFAEKTRSCVAILDPAPGISDIDTLTKVASSAPPKPPKPPAEGEKPEGRASVPERAHRPRQSEYGTVYFPWVYAIDPITQKPELTAPSGLIAGAWARTDADPGVHKAPANIALRGVTDVEYALTRSEQDVLNPAGVNCIRKFSDRGILVWGARTLAEEASEWRYLSVRRLAISLELAIERGTTWMVFEPNNHELWQSIRRDIGAFLRRVWRSGALFGRTPEEAYFVKCDEETNPPDVRDAGMVVAHIGIAVVKPAEFVVFKLSQWAGGSATETI